MLDNSNDVWVDNLNPFLIRFSDTFGIRWYGVSYLAGFIVGALFIWFLTKRARGALPTAKVFDFVVYIVIGVMLGGRLGYTFFYSPRLLIDFSSQFPYWGVLKIWQGGMSSHGGILGVITISIIFARRNKTDWLHLLDLISPGGCLGIFFGRIANFVNGELFGREVLPSSILWRTAVKFPGEMYVWLQQDIESTSSHALTQAASAIQAAGLNIQAFMTASLSVSSSRVARLQVQKMIERTVAMIQIGDEKVGKTLGPHLLPRYPSQLFEAGLEGLLLFWLVIYLWKTPRKPGVVCSVWLMAYSVVRIFGEQFRMPDAGIGFQLLGLTRGQWLSIASFGFACVLYAYAKKRDAKTVGGWCPRCDPEAVKNV